MSHQHEYQSMSAAASFEAMLAQVGQALDRSEAARVADARQIDALVARVGHLEQQFAGLDKKFTKILEERFKQAEPNALTFEFQQHNNLADALKTLFLAVDHELNEVYTQVYKVRPTDLNRAECVAWFLAGVFGAGNPRQGTEAPISYNSLNKSTRQRVDNLVKQVRELRRQATALDPNHVFQFESTPGIVNPDIQRAWRHCDPEGEISFVVTPAYVLGQRVFLHQEVFTVVRPVEMV